MGKVIFGMSDVQHKEWFIAALVSHIYTMLMQKKIASREEALEIAMKLEDSPVDEIGIGIIHIQSQLVNLTIQLHDIKKWKEGHEEVWCNEC